MSSKRKSWVGKKDGTTLPLTAVKSSKSRLCSIPGCTKQVQQGGVCCRHGAKTTRASCSHEGCTNVAKRGGLCRRHGAFKLKTCARQGCKRVAKQGQFCDVHKADPSKKRGANKATAKIARERSKTCSHHGVCPNMAKTGGFCGRHKDPIPTPSSSVQTSDGNILNNADHEAKPYGSTSKHTTCHEEGCTSTSSTMHESMLRIAGMHEPLCNHDGCNNQAVEGGESCMEHGQFNFLCDYYEELYDQLS